MIKGLGRVVGVIVLAASALAGCGSDDDNKGSGNTTRLDALTLEQRKALCDYAASQFGGYGKNKECSGGLTLEAPADQAECLEDYTYTNCSVTVAQAEQCVREQSCTTLVPASCQGLLSCS
ncbi:MAG: hypothetical protein ACOY0T_02830 [Myxococcota bacterium]